MMRRPSRLISRITRFVELKDLLEEINFQRRVDMAQKKNKRAKLKKLQRQVNKKLKNLVIPAGEDKKEYIAKTPAPLNLHVTGATVYLVGQNLAGDYLVGFVDRNGNSYTSTWP